MSLFTRLVSPAEGEVKIPVHSFMAFMAEIIRGEATKAELITAFSLTSGEQTELDILVAKGGSLLASQRFEYARVLHDMLLLSEDGLRYTTPGAFNSRIQREPSRPS